MRHVPLYFSFGLAFFAAVFGSIFFPFLHLSFFAPFLALAYHARPATRALWISLGCGVILDLLSSEFRFGLYSLAFVLTTLVLYPQKRHFFEDKPLAFSLFASLIAAFSTGTTLILAYLFDRSVPFSAMSAFIDLGLMSLIDGVYAFLWFTCPMRLYTYIKKVGWRNLFRKMETDEA